MLAPTCTVIVKPNGPGGIDRNVQLWFPVFVPPFALDVSDTYASPEGIVTFTQALAPPRPVLLAYTVYPTRSRAVGFVGATATSKSRIGMRTWKESDRCRSTPFPSRAVRRYAYVPSFAGFARAYVRSFHAGTRAGSAAVKVSGTWVATGR